MGSFNFTCGISGLPIWEGDEVIGIILKHVDHYSTPCQVDYKFKFTEDLVNGFYNGCGEIVDAEENIIMSDRVKRSGKAGYDNVDIWMCKVDVLDYLSENLMESNWSPRFEKRRYNVNYYIERAMENLYKIKYEYKKRFEKYEQTKDISCLRFEDSENMKQEATWDLECCGEIRFLFTTNAYAGQDISDDDMYKVKTAMLIVRVLEAIGKPIFPQTTIFSEADHDIHNHNFNQLGVLFKKIFKKRDDYFLE